MAQKRNAVRIHALPTETVRALQRGGPDAHGQPTERAISDGAGTPCRHCLHDVPAGAGMLILAYRPFDNLHPYAECGPIFLCADDCARWNAVDHAVPPVLRTSDDYLVKGYTADGRISYGTGQITPRDGVRSYATALLDRKKIAFVDVRSARNNCFLARITRD